MRRKVVVDELYLYVGPCTLLVIRGVVLGWWVRGVKPRSRELLWIIGDAPVN
jgi:hypothetical protein